MQHRAFTSFKEIISEMDMKIEFIARDKYWSEIQPYPKS